MTKYIDPIVPKLSFKKVITDQSYKIL